MGTLLCVEILPRTTDKPSLVLSSVDARSLSVGIISIEVKGSRSQRLQQYTLAQDPIGFERIYGVALSESWGAWCLGSRALFLLEHDCDPDEEILLTFHHQTFFRDRLCDLIVNATRYDGLHFNAQPVSINYAPPCFLPVSFYDDGSEIISVVIVAYRNAAMTACAALRSMGERIETIVVDNGSNDDKLLALEQALPIKLLRLHHRRSFGEANTLGIVEATGKKICLLNNDAFPEPECLPLLADVLDREDAIGFAAPILLNTDGSVQECGVDLDERGDGRHRTGELAELQTRQPLYTNADYVSAACLMFGRNTFELLGGFDPSFSPAYNEDADLCLRLKRFGLGLVVVSDALCIHVRNATLAMLKATMTVNWPESAHLIFEAKYKKWLASRDIEDVPTGPKPLQPPARSAPARKIVVWIGDDHATLPPGIMIAAELSDSFHVEVRSESQVSAAHLVFIGHNLDFRPFGPSSVGEGLEAADPAAPFVLTTVEFPPVPSVKVPSSARCFIFCPFPIKALLPKVALVDAVDLLSRCDRIVTTSSAGAAAIRAIASDFALPMSRIEIIPPAILEAVHVERDANERTVLALVDPHSSISADRVCSIFEESTRRTDGGADWRLVLVVPFSRYPRLERCSARHEVLLHATSREIAARISRARVVINALSPAHEVESLRYTALALQAMAEIIVERGSGAEAVCEDAGCGWRFRDEAGLALSLRHAVRDRQGPKASRPSPSAGPTFQEAWTALLDEVPLPTADRRSSTKTHRPLPRGREAFIVCGMHRSGTSAMAGLLSIARCTLPRTLMAPAADNPSGFWESDVVCAFNDRVLAASGSSWRDVFFSQDELPEDLVEEAIDLLRSEFEGEGPCVLKDPRISMVHPLWSAAFRNLRWRPHYVLMCREPRDVAMSLYRREKMNPRRALLLWAAYTSGSLIDLRNHSFSVVLHDDLMAEPLTTVERVFSEAGRKPPQPDIDFEVALRSFVHEPRLPSRFPYPSSFTPVERLYEFLRSGWSTREHDSAYRAGTDVRVWLRSLRELIGGELPV